MDIYSNKSSWKILLAAIATIIVVISMVYSQYLAKKLAEREDTNVEIYLEALDITISDATLETDEKGPDKLLAVAIQEKLYLTIPIITESEDRIFVGYNIGGHEETEDQEFLQKRVDKLVKNGFEPKVGPPGYGKYIYYENSRLYYLIRWFPLAQILLLGTFIFFSYFLFSSSRKSEQNRVWAGMAKETAHQLGTPISAILGWIQYLKEMSLDQPDNLDVINELTKDVKRLELVADRFSKIGSTPDLTRTNLVDELKDCVQYMERRASKKISFTFKYDEKNPIYADINSHLFDWVVENILRNALDAMESVGAITIKLTKEGEKAILLLSDSGKGMSPSNQKLVFNPGFTTKKRGWGLGLSLAKRIIENYHSGKIFVKSSKINEGTTFAIHLPIS